MIGRLRSLAVVLAIGVLSACSSTKPAMESASNTAAIGPPSSPAAEFERRQRERALAFTRKQQWSDAAIAWELLTVLRPENNEYRSRLADTQRQVEVAVAEHLPLAVKAAQRADLDVATKQYLAVLALQPGNAQAAEGLRALERERNRRNYLGKYSRNTLTRRAYAEAEQPTDVAPDRPDIEHAAMLADDGQLDDAIALLEHQLILSRNDAAARRLLANVYYREADTLLPLDRAGALIALRKSARLGPGDAKVAARLRELTGTAAPRAKSADPVSGVKTIDASRMGAARSSPPPVVAAAPNTAASGNAPAPGAASR